MKAMFPKFIILGDLNSFYITLSSYQHYLQSVAALPPHYVFTSRILSSPAQPQHPDQVHPGGNLASTTD